MLLGERLIGTPSTLLYIVVRTLFSNIKYEGNSGGGMYIGVTGSRLELRTSSFVKCSSLTSAGGFYFNGDSCFMRCTELDACFSGASGAAYSIVALNSYEGYQNVVKNIEIPFDLEAHDICLYSGVNHASLSSNNHTNCLISYVASSSTHRCVDFVSQFLTIADCTSDGSLYYFNLIENIQISTSNFVNNVNKPHLEKSGMLITFMGSNAVVSESCFISNNYTRLLSVSNSTYLLKDSFYWNHSTIGVLSEFVSNLIEKKQLMTYDLSTSKICVDATFTFTHNSFSHTLIYSLGSAAWLILSK